ncbi:MAG: hypothetical protein JWL83_1065 [Actinomycetia bacterium]|nr:hypothetical protein [Actinomycetes bacterium]
MSHLNPTERLRSITRRSLEDHALAIEAAEALSAFAPEPASLVVACRRLLAHHRSHGALWWLCARVLAAADPALASREAVRLLDADRTADRLAANLPLLDEDDVVAVIGWPYAVDCALSERLDIETVSVRTEGADTASALRQRRREGRVRTVDEWDLATMRVARLLVPAAAIGGGRAVVPAGTATTLDIVGSAGESWLVGGVGRVLPRRLFEALEAAVANGVGHLDAPDDEAPTEIVSLEKFDRVAGPRGLEAIVDAEARPDCPVVPELLRPL